MPDMEQQLRDAYRYFDNWDNDRDKFEALLAEDVVWIETDQDLGPGRYEGKTAVMNHVDQIRQALAQAALVSVASRGPLWRTTDEMQAQGHEKHDCVTDVAFDGGLISQVRHCLSHGGGP